MFTIYRVQTSNLDAPRATVAGEVGSERLAQALCERMNRTGRDNGQTAYIWTEVSYEVEYKVDRAIRDIQRCDTAEQVGLIAHSRICQFNGSEAEKTAFASLLVYRLGELEKAGKINGLNGAAIPPAV